MEQKDKPFYFFSDFSSWLIAALFLFLYFILSFHSRIAGDDFYYLWLKNTYGAWGGMLYQYNAWSGRWFAHFAGCAMISEWENPAFLPLINLATIVLLYLSLDMLFRKLMKAIGVIADRKIIFPLIIIFICSSFFLSYEIGETWFWYIIILTYLWSIIAFVLLINCIFSEKKSLLNYFLIAIFSAYIGGASESYAIIFVGLLMLLYVYTPKSITNQSLSPVANRILFSLIILAVSFSFSAFAPGTEIRHSLLPHTSLIDKIWISFKAYLKYFIRFLPDKLIYIVLFSSPWLMFGSNFLKSKYSAFEAKKMSLKLTLIFLAILIIMFIPTSFIMSETGPGRALSVISFLTAIYFAIIFALAGVIYNFNNFFVRIFFSGAMTACISILIYHIYIQYTSSKIFSAACDERLKVISEAKKNNFNRVLELKKIPPAGMLYWDELSVDTSYYVNKHLKDGLGLPFSVMLKPE